MVSKGISQFKFYKNDLKNSESMAIISWFVPILNLYKPFQVMKELFLQSKAVIENHDPNKEVKINVAYVIVGWVMGWLALIVGLYLKIFNISYSLMEFSNFIRVEMLFDWIRIISALLAIKVVSDYSKIEKVLRSLYIKIESKDKNPNSSQV
jgi:hypothetical protein